MSSVVDLLLQTESKYRNVPYCRPAKCDACVVPEGGTPLRHAMCTPAGGSLKKAASLYARASTYVATYHAAARALRCGKQPYRLPGFFLGQQRIRAGPVRVARVR